MIKVGAPTATSRRLPTTLRLKGCRYGSTTGSTRNESRRRSTRICFRSRARKMTEEGYAEVDGAAYERLRKSLLREKGADRQREFLAAARSNERFLDYFGREAPVTAGATVPVYEDYFTEESYRDPPADVEEELYAVWLELTPRVACRATLWAAVT